MRAFEKRNPVGALTRAEALDCIPVKSAAVEDLRLQTGEALLSYPMQMRPWLAGLMRRLGKVPQGPHTKKLQLDTLGTAVWDLMDGRRSVNQVIQRVAATYRLHPKEAELSVTRFMHELGRRGLIALK